MCSGFIPPAIRMEVESIDVETRPRQVRKPVKVASIQPSKPRGGKHVDYAPKGSPPYGDKEPRQMCEGIAGFPASQVKPVGMIRRITAIRRGGGADRSGICVSSPGKNNAMPK